MKTSRIVLFVAAFVAGFVLKSLLGERKSPAAPLDIDTVVVNVPSKSGGEDREWVTIDVGTFPPGEPNAGCVKFLRGDTVLAVYRGVTRGP